MKTTIFYENSFGIISQWTGEILEMNGNIITIKTSPKKAYKFDLKANSEFMIVCKKKIKPLPLLNSEHHKNYWTAFDEKLRFDILQELEKTNNIAMYWNGNNFN
jgi:hypothetical protein